MKAITNRIYGSPDVLKLEEVERPTPKDNEVLIKVHTSAVNAGDWHLMRGEPKLMRLMGFGVFKPTYTILGLDVAGTVTAVGSKVAQYKVGDDVMGDLSVCGFGAFAEYVCATEKAIVTKPANISFEDAAATSVSSLVALQALRDKANVQSGQKVLINGASGGVGSFAVQIAKHFGAEVTGVCSTKNVDRVRASGADHVIDYTKENFTESGKQYDVILAANGYHPLAHYKRALTPTGKYIQTGGSNSQLWEVITRGAFNSKSGGQKMMNMLVKPNPQDLAIVRDMLSAGKIKPVIDRRYPLAETADAIRYIEEGHAGGKVIINVT